MMILNEALKGDQDKYAKNSDTYKDSLSFPIRSSVAGNHEKRGTWMHRVSEEANSSDHRGRTYIVRVIKTDRLIMQKIIHINRVPVTTEQYLQEQIKKVTG